MVLLGTLECYVVLVSTFEGHALELVRYSDVDSDCSAAPATNTPARLCMLCLIRNGVELWLLSRVGEFVLVIGTTMKQRPSLGYMSIAQSHVSTVPFTAHLRRKRASGQI
jgi:hypothetical protein